jgi:hypothetical protein
MNGTVANVTTQPDSRQIPTLGYALTHQEGANR